MEKNSIESEGLLNPIHKALIGAIGGLCLVSLKLIESNFYIDNPASNQALAAYFTYAIYIFLGVVVALFLTDHELSKEKAKKSALVMGLLAPSILIAIVSNPSTATDGAESILNKIPDLGGFFIGTSYASGVENLDKNTSKVADESEQKIKIIYKKDVDVPLVKAVMSAFGRGKIESKYVYVVGSSDDSNKAIEVSEMLNKLLNCEKNKEYCAEVYSPNGSSKKYVVVGGFQYENAVYTTKAFGQQAAFASLKILDKENHSDSKSASLLFNGRVMKGINLFK